MSLLSSVTIRCGVFLAVADYIYVEYASSTPFLIPNYTYYPSVLRKIEFVRVRETNSGTRLHALAISNYIWDGSDMICEYASSATSGKVYIYGHTLISQGKWIHWIPQQKPQDKRPAAFCRRSNLPQCCVLAL